TGVCSNPTQANGTACNDGTACTTGDACTAGACPGGAALSCDDGNPCTDDVCDPAVGCRHTNNTAPCNDGNACTQTDVCSAGVCGGSNPVVCVASDQCHPAGPCNATTGLRSNPERADGTPRND